MKMSCIYCGEFIWMEDDTFYNDSDHWAWARCEIDLCPGCGNEIRVEDLIPEEE